jgi:hypothetical protein
MAEGHRGWQSPSLEKQNLMPCQLDLPQSLIQPREQKALVSHLKSKRLGERLPQLIRLPQHLEANRLSHALPTKDQPNEMHPLVDEALGQIALGFLWLLMPPQISSKSTRGKEWWV